MNFISKEVKQKAEKNSHLFEVIQMFPIFLRASWAASEMEYSGDPTGSIFKISYDSWSNFTIYVDKVISVY